jgi:hypothetical protein
MVRVKWLKKDMMTVTQALTNDIVEHAKLAEERVVSLGHAEGGLKMG